MPVGIPLKTFADSFTKVMGTNTRWWAEVFGSPLQLILASVLPGFVSGPAHPLLVQAPSHHLREHVSPTAPVPAGDHAVLCKALLAAKQQEGC